VTIWLMIAGMAVITFTVRYVFLARSVPIAISPAAQRLLTYSAPAVLTAMWVPIVFMPNGELAMSVTNPSLLAAIIAVILAVSRVHMLVVVIASMVSFLLLRHFLGASELPGGYV